MQAKVQFNQPWKAKYLLPHSHFFSPFIISLTADHSLKPLVQAGVKWLTFESKIMPWQEHCHHHWENGPNYIGFLLPRTSFQAHSPHLLVIGRNWVICFWMVTTSVELCHHLLETGSWIISLSPTTDFLVLFQTILATGKNCKGF